VYRWNTDITNASRRTEAAEPAVQLVGRALFLLDVLLGALQGLVADGNRQFGGRLRGVHASSPSGSAATSRDRDSRPPR
jgi:hypothetical protein